MYRDICTNLPILVQVVRIPDAKAIPAKLESSLVAVPSGTLLYMISYMIS
jgi:hypothetical protein